MEEYNNKEPFKSDPFLRDPYNYELTDYAVDCLDLSPNPEEITTKELKNRLWGSGIVDLASFEGSKAVADARVYVAAIRARGLFEEISSVVNASNPDEEIEELSKDV